MLIERHSQITNATQWSDIIPANCQLVVSSLVQLLQWRAKTNELCFISVQFKAVRGHPTIIVVDACGAKVYTAGRRSIGSTAADIVECVVKNVGLHSCYE